MNDKIYYTVLYEASYPDAGVVAYKPVKTIRGTCDFRREVFTDLETKEEYRCVNDVIPTFGSDEDNLLCPLENEMVYDTWDDGTLFYAFPIEEDVMLSMLAEQGVAIDPFIVYERSVRSYFLYSVYDEQADDNLFYIMDKYDSHSNDNIDVNDDIMQEVGALSNEQMMRMAAKLVGDALGGNTPIVVVQPYNMFDYDDDVEEDQSITPENTSFTPINYDFDPDELEKMVCSEVIAQDHVASALVSMLYKNKHYHDHDGLKSNMLILGPSGCGKTELVRSIKRHTDIPIVFFDASTATASGYVGNSTSQAIRSLISACGGDIQKAEHGIVFIDEIDKLIGNGINKQDVQDELFKMLEGDEIVIPAENYHDSSITFNTKDLTFICAGAAQDLIEQKKKEMHDKRTKVQIGFNISPDESSKEEKNAENNSRVVLGPEDLIKYGLKPELLRRLQIIKVVNELSKSDLVTILTDSNISPLKIYEKAFSDVDNTELIYDGTILECIAEKSMKEKAGASGLKRIVDDMLQVAVRKVRLLNGEKGELILKKETIEDPKDFVLYAINDQAKRQVYPPEEKAKVKTIGTKK